VLAYHNLTPNSKSFQEVSQWNGKEMNEISQYQLEVVTQSLRGGSSPQRPILNRAMVCTQPFLKVYMYARYKSHDDATLSYMEDALRRLHTFKDVFLLVPGGKKVKATANALKTELVKKRKVHVETNAESWTPSKKRCEMTAWLDYTSHKIDVSKKLDADFNFPNIDLMSH
jgi:predicted choloylglycine hydrolase